MDTATALKNLPSMDEAVCAVRPAIETDHEGIVDSLTIVLRPLDSEAKVASSEYSGEGTVEFRGETMTVEELSSLISNLLNARRPSSTELSLCLMNAGELRLFRDGKLVEPVETIMLLCEYAGHDAEAMATIEATVRGWGFVGAPLTEREQKELGILAEYTPSGTDIETVGSLCALLLDAQMPLFSLSRPRTRNGYSDGTGDDELLLSVGPEWLRAHDLRTAAMEAFGFVRRDLMKLMAVAPLHFTTWLSMFSNYLSQDQIVRAYRMILEDKDFYPVPGVGPGVINDLLPSIQHPTSRLNLAIKRGGRADDFYFTNGDMSPYGPDGKRLTITQKINSWSLIPRCVMEAYAASSTYYDSSQEAPGASLAGQKFLSYTLAVVNTVSALVGTGAGLAVCVGRLEYLYRVESGNTILIRLDKGDEMVALAEFERRSDGFVLVELKGRANEEAPKDIDEKMLAKVVNDAC